jgi:hypothetical protein
MKLFFRYQKLSRRMSRRASGDRSVRLARRWLRVKLAQMNILMDQLARSVFLDGLLKKEPNHFARKGLERGLVEANNAAIEQFGWPLHSSWTSKKDVGFYRKVFASVVNKTGRDDAEDIMQDILSVTDQNNKFWAAGKNARSGFRETTTANDEAKRAANYAVKEAISRYRTRERSPEFLTEEGELFEQGLRSDVDTDDVHGALMNMLAEQSDPDTRTVMNYLSSTWKPADHRLIAVYQNKKDWKAAAKELGLSSPGAARKKWSRFLDKTRKSLRKALNNPADEVAQALVRILNRVGATMETGGYSGQMPGMELFRRAHRLVEMWHGKA